MASHMFVVQMTHNYVVDTQRQKLKGGDDSTVVSMNLVHLRGGGE